MRGLVSSLLHFLNGAFDNRGEQYVFVDFYAAAFLETHARNSLAQLKANVPDIRYILIGPHENYFLLDGRIRFDLNGFFVVSGGYRVNVPSYFLDINRQLQTNHGIVANGFILRSFNSRYMAQHIYEYAEENGIKNPVLLLNSDFRFGIQYFTDIFKNVFHFNDFNMEAMYDVAKKLER